MCAFALAVTAITPLGCGYDTSAYRPPPEEVSAIENLDLPQRPPTSVEAAHAATLPTTLPATVPVAERPLTLQEVRELALRHNLELESVRLDPLIAAEELRAENAAYEAVFTTDASYAWFDQPVGGRVVGGQVVGSQIERMSIAPGISQPLRTGGRLDASLPLERLENKTDTGDEGGNDSTYESDFRLAYIQPLGEGFGPDVNALGIRLATVSLGQAQVRRKLEVINILSAADREYWLLYAARRAVDVQRQQYDLSVQQLDRVRRQVAAGAQTQVEVFRAESDVADALELLITAGNLLRERGRSLKRILNAPELDMSGPTTLIPETLPTPVLYELDGDRLTELAMERRMELLDVELAIAAQTAQVLAARNRTLPRLDLLAGWNVNGRGGSISNSLEQTGTADFQDYDVGLALAVPLGNQQARSNLRAALLRRLQTLSTKESRILEIQQEVLNAADRLETAWHRIVASRRRVELSARLLDAQTRQFDLGLNTGLEVSTARTDLAQAQRAEIVALTEYEIARVDLAVATGTVIGRNRIVLDMPSADAYE